MRARERQRGTASAAVVAFVLALAILVRPAHAQSAQVGKADALFNAGRSLLEAGEYVEACPKFAEAQTLAPGLGVTLYLADCYERTGRTASASVEFRRAEQIASTRHDPRGAVAHDRAVALVEHVPQLAIVVTEAARAQGVAVTCDGEPVPTSRWGGLPEPIDPGDHEIVVSAPSKVVRRTTVTLAPLAGTVMTSIDALDDRLPPPPPLLPATRDFYLPDVVEARATQKTVGFIVGGVGLLGVGVGSALGILASSKLSQSNAGPCDSTDHCSSQGLDLRRDADHFGNASTGVFLGAGAALAAGVVLYLTAPKTSRPPYATALRQRSAF